MKKDILAKISLIGLIAYAMSPMVANAAVGLLSSRSATLSNSAGGATGVTATFKFNPSVANSGASVKAIKFEMCNSPIESVACTAVDGTASLSSATAGSQTGTDITNQYGTVVSQSATSVIFKNVSGLGNTLNSGNSVTFPVQNITLPTTNNLEFYLRVTTYNDATTQNGTTEVDFGGIAVSTSQVINVTGIMPESLVFCVGTSGTTCAAGGSQITGNSVNLGTFTPTGTNTGTSRMAVSTNAGSGYAITINGTTLTSGGNTITAMGTQSANSAACSPSCTSTTGTSQFGTNVRANTTPTVGADVTPTGAGFNGAGSGGYNTVNSFRFFTGDTVASSSNVSNEQLFTNSYIVNVPGSQAAGTYTATMTYICTATF